MKIVIIGTAHPYRGGLAAYNERLAHEFVRQGHEVEVLTFTLQYPSFLFPGKTQYSAEKPPKNLKIFRKINSINPFNWWKTGREIKRKQPDLIVYCYWTSFMAPCFGTIARFAKNPKSKHIALIHNMLPHEQNLLDKIFPAYFVKPMDGFVAMAESVVRDIDKFDRHAKPKIVSPHPIYDHYGELMSKQTARKHLNLDENYDYALFFGFIRHYKGLDLLLDAFGDERIKQLKIKLLIAGEFYETPDFYYQKVKDLNIADRVIFFPDYISDDEVKYYFCAADIVAQPYRSATQSGVSQIAYHFEKPMLVTDVGGLAEIVPNGKVGYVVDIQPKAIADALIDFFENKRENIFIENIRAEKQKYSWAKMTEAVLKCREEILK